MLRKLSCVAAGYVLLTITARWTAGPVTCPRAAVSPARAAVSPIAEAGLLALEEENGCLDTPEPAAASQSWPDWAAAHVAGGEVAPIRVVSDPYPTLHSVAVDPDRN